MATTTPRKVLCVLIAAICFAGSIRPAVSGGPVVENIPSWHPHRLKRQRQETVTQAEKITSSFECGHFENSKWKRKFCFGQMHVVQENIGIEKLTEVKMNLTITKQMKSGGADAPWANTCKDSMRIRFRSLRSLFAPYQEEVECGVHELSFIVPPDASEYTLDLFLVHIDGEGMGEPPYSRLYPENLVNHNDGPAFYNVKVAFDGNQRLRVPRGYLQDEDDDADPYFLRSAEEPLWMNGQRQRQNKRPALPQCETGDGPGRWVFHHSIYPDFPGEPLVWRPYNCHFKLVTGSQLKDCLKRVGKTMTFGESTLNQIHDVMQLHMNESGYYWPARIIAPNPQVYKRLHPELYGTEQHGMSVMLGGGVDELLEQNPDVLVILQGANDPARDSLANYEMRFKEFVGKVKAWREEGKLKFRKVILISAPTRQNKQGGYAGQTVCPDGQRETCVVTPSSAFIMPNAEVRWITVKDSVDNIVQFWGTLDRRRAGNKMTRRVMGEAFPDDTIFIDYEALTAALPADYCIDGEHWGCPWHAWMWREKTPYLCKALANLAVANILSNILCQLS